jgi:hypothetical protein
MSSSGRSACGRLVLFVTVVMAGNAAEGASPKLKLTAWDQGVVDRARAGAVKRLAQPECQKLFDDFRDAQGRTLRQNLEEWTSDPVEYLGLVPFVDGTSQPNCRSTKVALSATVGTRRVFVCRGFGDFQMRQPGVAESMVIHEILHTLGLGESPQKGAPTSIEITQRVESRCR